VTQESVNKQWLESELEHIRQDIVELRQELRLKYDARLQGLDERIRDVETRVAENRVRIMVFSAVFAVIGSIVASVITAAITMGMKGS